MKWWKWIGLCLLFFASTAHAHKLGEGYIYLKVYNDRIEGRVEMTVDDLDKAVGLDQSQDGIVSAEELSTNIDSVHQYLAKTLQWGPADAGYAVRYVSHEVMNVQIGRYAVLHFLIDLPDGVPDILELSYACLFETDPKQRGLLILEWNEKTQTEGDESIAAAIFRPGHERQEVDLVAPVHSSTFLAFVRHGIWHIWIGIDHILFLMAFVLQAVVIVKNHRWQPVADFRPAFMTAVKIVTLFTIAHSITLSLAALGIVNLPSRLIESVIAASVVVAALNGIFPVMGNHIGVVIFGFGLFHGFGFASVLGHLGLQRGSVVLPLVGFNVGVEIGQIAVICIAVPIFYLLSRQKAYPGAILKGSSAIIAVIALVWLVERAFDLDPILI